MSEEASLPRSGLCFWLVKAHFLYDTTNQTHYPDLGSERVISILKFHDIYLIQLGLFMYSYQNHTLPSKFHCKFTLQSQIHSYNTRNSCKFRLPFCRTRTKQFSVFYQGPKFYNTLNTNTINASSPSLKEHLRNLFVIITSILQQKSWEKAF